MQVKKFIIVDIENIKNKNKNAKDIFEKHKIPKRYQKIILSNFHNANEPLSSFCELTTSKEFKLETIIKSKKVVILSNAEDPNLYLETEVNVCNEQLVKLFYQALIDKKIDKSYEKAVKEIFEKTKNKINPFTKKLSKK